jgi:hypothetical protein
VPPALTELSDSSRAFAAIKQPLITSANRKREISVMCSLKICHYLVVTLCMLGPLTCVAHGGNINGEATYMSFSVPGALGTHPMSINNSMIVTGYYTTSSTTAAGFIRDADGAITTFSVAGSLWTEPEGINVAGDITGFYEVVSGIPQGFTRYADGRIITFDPPEGQAGPQAQPVSINNFGEVAGNDPYPDGNSAGFTRSRAGGFATINYSAGTSYATVVTGLNSNGAIVGYCSGCVPNSAANSFVLHPDGYMAQFSVPLDGPISPENATIAETINDNGVIAGWYGSAIGIGGCNCAGSSGGFVRSPQGDITLFHPPGTLLVPPLSGVFGQHGSSVLITNAKLLSMNSEGALTGSYVDTELIAHGFVRNPYGNITSFDPPRGVQTVATSINDIGVIAGSYYYEWNNQIAEGFLRVPQP